VVVENDDPHLDVMGKALGKRQVATPAKQNDSEGTGTAKGIGGIAEAVSCYVFPGPVVFNGDGTTQPVATPFLLEVRLHCREVVIHLRVQTWLRDVAWCSDAIGEEDPQFLSRPWPPGPHEALPVDFPAEGLAEAIAVAGMSADEGKISIGSKGRAWVRLIASIRNLNSQIPGVIDPLDSHRIVDVCK
jgi:hypothetical protein